MSGVEKGAVLALWRVTYGWANGNKRKTEETISSDGWAKMLNTSPAYSARIVQRLVQDKVFIRKDDGQGNGYTYSMNTRVNQWVEGKLNGLGLSERFNLPLTNKYRVPLTKRFTLSATKLDLPKTSIKTSNKENIGNNSIPRDKTGKLKVGWSGNG